MLCTTPFLYAYTQTTNTTKSILRIVVYQTSCVNVDDIRWNRTFAANFMLLWPRFSCPYWQKFRCVIYFAILFEMHFYGTISCVPSIKNTFNHFFVVEIIDLDNFLVVLKNTGGTKRTTNWRQQLNASHKFVRSD